MASSQVSKIVRIEGGSSDKTTTGLETRRPKLPQSHDYLNIISVVGKARTGKSWLLNYLAQSPSLFEVHNDDVCTSGIELSSPMSFPGLKEEVVYMNVEGSGEASDERALRLHTVAMLFSKVYIYQIRGTVLLEDFLKEISSLTEVGKKVQLSQNSSGTKTRPFGHLVIVCRDYTSQKVREPDLLSKLTKLEPTDDVYNEETMDAILRRNSRRTQLSNFFASISVVCLPPPCKNTEDLRTSSLKFEKVWDEFKQSVVRLQSIIRGKFEDKSHNVFNEPLRFSNFFTLLETMVQTLNRGDIIVPAEILEKMRSIILQKAANCAREYFNREIKQLQEKISESFLPNIEGAISKILRSTKEKFMSEMPADVSKSLNNDSKMVDEKLKALNADFEIVLDLLRSKNSQAKTTEELVQINSELHQLLSCIQDDILVPKMEEAPYTPQRYPKNFYDDIGINLEAEYYENSFEDNQKVSPPGPLRKDGKPDMRFAANKKAYGSASASTPSQNSSYSSAPGPLRKDGNPDMRYTANKTAYGSASTASSSANYSSGPLRKDGNPDMRYTANKLAYGASSTSASSYSSGPSRSSTSAPGPLTKAGKPDMRYKANKMAYG